MWFIKDLQSYVNDIKAQTTVNDIKKMLFENSKWYDSDPDEQTYDLADVISLKNVYYTEDTADEAIAKIIFAEKGTVYKCSYIKNLQVKADCSSKQFLMRRKIRIWRRQRHFLKMNLTQRDEKMHFRRWKASSGTV